MMLGSVFTVIFTRFAHKSAFCTDDVWNGIHNEYFKLRLETALNELKTLMVVGYSQ